MLAMATEKNKTAEGEEASPTAQRPVSTANVLPDIRGTSLTSIQNLHRLQATEADKLNDLQQRNFVSAFRPNSLLAASSLTVNTNNARLLEQQILLLQQQEEANRILLQRALLLQRQQRRPLNVPNNTSPYNILAAEEQKLQDDQSLRLRQLLSIGSHRRSDKGHSTKPSNDRASAA